MCKSENPVGRDSRLPDKAAEIAGDAERHTFDACVRTIRLLDAPRLLKKGYA